MRRRGRATLVAVVGALAVSASTADAATLLTQWGTPGRANGQFTNPNDLAVGAGGQVYVADTDNHRIQRFTADGAYVGQWGTFGGQAGQFSSPSGIAIDSGGNVYVADRGNSRVQKFSADGTFQRMWGYGVSTGGQTFEICTTPPCRAGLPGTGPGQLGTPHGLAVDPNGNVYVTDFFDNQIERFTSDGSYSGLVWGSAGLAQGQFNRPVGIAAGALDVYVADRDNSRIQRFDLQGNSLGLWGSPGDADGQFAGPQDVTIAPDGHVYVSDNVNYRVQSFSAAGVFLSKFNTLAPAGDVFRPQSVAFSPGGDLYIIDGQANFSRVLKVRDEVAPPVLGKAVNVDVVKGTVLVAVRGSGARASQKGLTFVPLSEGRQIPTGSFLDTKRGTVELTSATGAGGKTQSGQFTSGIFQVLQSRKKREKGLTELRLKGSSFRSCTKRRGKRASSAALSKRTIRRLKSNAKGRFTTRARRSAATVRGTIWITADRCDGTLTTVKRGRVAVRDFRRKKTVIVRAGKSYLAR
jgi:sugar lactone lactonase YvrE